LPPKNNWTPEIKIGTALILVGDGDPVMVMHHLKLQLMELIVISPVIHLLMALFKQRTISISFICINKSEEAGGPSSDLR
jgi:hypothetical protein